MRKINRRNGRGARQCALGTQALRYWAHCRAPLLVFILCSAAYAGQLGVVDFPTSGPPAAQSHFLQGVLLLHNFQYTEAQNEFAAAEKIAPDFAMSYWGEAMTYNHPLWHEQDQKAAVAALARLAHDATARLAKAP